MPPPCTWWTRMMASWHPVVTFGVWTMPRPQIELPSCTFLISPSSWRGPPSFPRWTWCTGTIRYRTPAGSAQGSGLHTLRPFWISADAFRTQEGRAAISVSYECCAVWNPFLVCLLEWQPGGSCRSSGPPGRPLSAVPANMASLSTQPKTSLACHQLNSSGTMSHFREPSAFPLSWFRLLVSSQWQRSFLPHTRYPSWSTEYWRISRPTTDCLIICLAIFTCYFPDGPRFCSIFLLPRLLFCFF